MGIDQSRFAPSEPPKRPWRVWDDERKLWVEAHSLCRNSRGLWVRKNGREPSAQLLLFDKDCN